MKSLLEYTGFIIWFRRLKASVLLGGQVVIHLLQGKIHRRNTLEQLAIVGPESLLIALLTAVFVGMVFTIQVAREFITFGLVQAIGGVLALALTRELAPVLTAVIVTGRVCSAFAAEIGTMRVTEQIDAMQMLDTDPIDYLVIPRLLACSIMLPMLTLFSLVAGVMGGMVVAGVLYGIPMVAFIDSVQGFLDVWDIGNCMIKAAVFGGIIAIVGSSWGLTTTGGARGVGQSTTAAVVTALLSVFVSNFLMSWIMFQGAGSAALRNL
ncbi:MAG: MlaE family lipid ABC transporter permease subunit [Acaryochloridaceae cyanobacterium SU_2_1]|nr:MlaE family lipid ABC transporter permease subunit [Acaryochloridaceae cyanobacterium SU_2_1]